MNMKKNVIWIILALGFLQIAAFYISGVTVRADRAFPITQPDTLLYCQAARRIVEGHPFSFSQGAAVSTGTTSVLYPFALAVPAALGAKGDALFLGGFLLNAAFYLLFLFGWGVVIREKCEDGIPMLLGMLLIVFSGQAAFCALAASDTGMWMAASALIAAGLVTEKKKLYFPLLALGPWIRPEGVMLAVALAFCSFLAVIYGKRNARAPFVASLIALFSFLCVGLLNLALSGHFGFASVANKGHFILLPFADGVVLTVVDFVKILKALFLGLPVALPRDFQILPVIGALFLWLGVFTRNWQREGWWKEAGWLLAGGMGVLSVALGGCEGENMDRYLAWFLPTMAIFVSDGVAWFANRLGTPSARFVPALLLGAYAVMADIACVMLFHVGSSHTDVIRSFATDCAVVLPKKASVGVFGGCGIAYQMEDRPVKHLVGMYSPEFSIGNPAYVLEVLKHESATRFDYWFLNQEKDKSFVFTSGKSDFDSFGEVVLRAPQGFELRKADWSIFDRAAAVPVPKENRRKLVARVDIGYDPDEKAASYEPLTIYDQPVLQPFTQVAKNKAGKQVFETGRVLLGGDEMTIGLKPNCDVEVVMRTLPKVSAVAPGVFGVSIGGDYSFKSPMELFVMVDGESVGKVAFEINADGFTDAHFTIPGSAIKQSPCRIGFHGEHAACCYWFFQ